MTEQTQQASTRTFNVGEALGGSLSIFTRHFLVIFGISALIRSPILIYNLYQDPPDPDPANNLKPELYLMAAANILLQYFSTSVICAAVFHGLIKKPITFTQSTAIACKRFFPILGLFIVQCLIFGGIFFAYGMIMVILMRALNNLGAILLIPISILFMWVLLSLYISFFLSFPAVILEKADPIKSLSRSKFLVRKYRTFIFGLIFVYVVVAGGINLGIVGLLTYAPTLINNLDIALVVVKVGEFLPETVFNGFFAVLITVCYYQLRCVKEGLDVAQLVTAFDE